MSITSDSPSESDGLSATLNNGTANVGGLETLVASVVVIDKMAGGAVVDGVGGTTDIGLMVTADVMVAVVVAGAAIAVVEVGVVADVVMGGAVLSAMGGAPVVSEIGGAADSVTGEAPDVLVVEDISLVVDLVTDVRGNESAIKVGGAVDVIGNESAIKVGGAVDVIGNESAIKVGGAVDIIGNESAIKVGGAVDVIGNESAIKVGGAVDTTTEDKVVVDDITLEVGGAVVAVGKVGGGAVVATEVGGALVEIRVGLFMDKVEGAENVTEDLIVVAATAGVAVTGVAKVGIDPDKTGLVLSDKMGVAAVESLSAGDLVKVSSCSSSSCSSSDCSVSSSLVTSLSFCPLNGFVRLSVILGSLALNE